MKSIKAALASWLDSRQPADFDDPVLGLLAWQPATQVWVSRHLAEQRPFCFKFKRHKKAITPADECLRVARTVAGAPGALEEQVRQQLAYAAAHRSEGVQTGVTSLRISCVVLETNAGKVSGEVLLQGDGEASNWVVWHEDGVPSLATQQWE